MTTQEKKYRDLRMDRGKQRHAATKIRINIPPFFFCESRARLVGLSGNGAFSVTLSIGMPLVVSVVVVPGICSLSVGDARAFQQVNEVLFA